MNIQMTLLIALVILNFFMEQSGYMRTRHGKKVCVSISTIILALFSGLRTWWIGDCIKYYTLFVNCNSNDWKSYVFEKPENIGIRLFFKAVGYFGFKFEVAIFIIAALSAAAIGYIIYKYSPSPLWSYTMWIAMGFYIFTYSGLKQTIAMAFLMFAMDAVIKDKLWRFLFWMLIAGLFHAPAFIFLLAYPFARRHISRTQLLILVLLIAVVFVFRNQIVGWLTELYYEDSEEALMASKMIGGRFLMMGFILVVSLIIRPLRRGDLVYSKVFTVMLLALTVQMFSVFDNNFSRLADYFYQFIILFMPMVLEYENSSNFQTFKPDRRVRRSGFTRQSYQLFCLVIIGFAFFYYNSYIGSSSAVLKDFKFLWEIDPYQLYGG